MLALPSPLTSSPKTAPYLEGLLALVVFSLAFVLVSFRSRFESSGHHRFTIRAPRSTHGKQKQAGRSRDVGRFRPNRLKRSEVARRLPDLDSDTLFRNLFRSLPWLTAAIVTTAGGGEMESFRSLGRLFIGLAAFASIYAIFTRLPSTRSSPNLRLFLRGLFIWLALSTVVQAADVKAKIGVPISPSLPRGAERSSTATFSGVARSTTKSAAVPARSSALKTTTTSKSSRRRCDSSKVTSNPQETASPLTGRSSTSTKEQGSSIVGALIRSRGVDFPVDETTAAKSLLYLIKLRCYLNLPEPVIGARVRLRSAKRQVSERIVGAGSEFDVNVDEEQGVDVSLDPALFPFLSVYFGAPIEVHLFGYGPRVFDHDRSRIAPHALFTVQQANPFPPAPPGRRPLVVHQVSNSEFDGFVTSAEWATTRPRGDTEADIVNPAPRVEPSTSTSRAVPRAGPSYSTQAPRARAAPQKRSIDAAEASPPPTKRPRSEPTSATHDDFGSLESRDVNDLSITSLERREKIAIARQVNAHRRSREVSRREIKSKEEERHLKQLRDDLDARERRVLALEAKLALRAARPGYSNGVRGFDIFCHILDLCPRIRMDMYATAKSFRRCWLEPEGFAWASRPDAEALLLMDLHSFTSQQAVVEEINAAYSTSNKAKGIADSERPRLVVMLVKTDGIAKQHSKQVVGYAPNHGSLVVWTGSMNASMSGYGLGKLESTTVPLNASYETASVQYLPIDSHQAAHVLAELDSRDRFLFEGDRIAAPTDKLNIGSRDAVSRVSAAQKALETARVEALAEHRQSHGLLTRDLLDEFAPVAHAPNPSLLNSVQPRQRRKSASPDYVKPPPLPTVIHCGSPEIALGEDEEGADGAKCGFLICTSCGFPDGRRYHVWCLKAPGPSSRIWIPQAEILEGGREWQEVLAETIARIMAVSVDFGDGPVMSVLLKWYSELEADLLGIDGIKSHLVAFLRRLDFPKASELADYYAKLLNPQLARILEYEFSSDIYITKRQTKDRHIRLVHGQSEVLKRYRALELRYSRRPASDDPLPFSGAHLDIFQHLSAVRSSSLSSFLASLPSSHDEDYIDE
ncbi:hypothetical protein JCM10212_002938 [Sporobolomyces blumeae]